MGVGPVSGGVLGWHFLGDDGRVARLGTKVTAGLVLAMPGPVTLCSRGFHASVRAIDALGYAQGNVVERVRLSGVVVKGADKMVATRRACLWVLTREDTERCLWVAACNFAQVALDAERAAGRTPDPRSQAAIDTRLRWINDEVTDAELCAAYKAARNAANHV